MSRAFSVVWLLSSNDRPEPQLLHVFVNGNWTKEESTGDQQYRHNSESGDTPGPVINRNYFRLDMGSLLKTGILASFAIIVIPVWIDFKLPKKPAKTELAMILLNKLGSGYSISFAKNAAAFFKKAISFSFSASSRRNLVFSSQASVCSFN